MSDLQPLQPKRPPYNICEFTKEIDGCIFTMLPEKDGYELYFSGYNMQMVVKMDKERRPASAFITSGKNVILLPPDQVKLAAHHLNIVGTLFMEDIGINHATRQILSGFFARNLQLAGPGK